MHKEIIWPFLGPHYNTAPIIQGTQKGTLIFTTTHIIRNNGSVDLFHGWLTTEFWKGCGVRLVHPRTYYRGLNNQNGVLGPIIAYL